MAQWIFQVNDDDGKLVGEPWFWPEAGSALVFESPQILESQGQAG